VSAERPTSRLLGVTWLVAAALVGVAGILLVVASDHARDHRAGATLLVLAVVAVVVGAGVIRAADRRVGRASVAASALWLAGAVVVFLSLTFTTDRLVFAGVPAVVGLLTAAVALRPGRR
jgi:drug/metabolite transporter (DMT)-like permease